MTQVLCGKIKSRTLIDDFMIADRWIDYQDVFKMRFDLDRCYSIEYALPESDEHLSCTIGDLFEGLQLKFG